MEGERADRKGPRDWFEEFIINILRRYASSATADRIFGKYAGLPRDIVADRYIKQEARVAALAEWQGLQSIGMIQAQRRIDQERTEKRRYFISGLESNAEQLLNAARTYWGIEDKVHWVLDIAFREDDSRVRQGTGAQNLATLRHIALNQLRREGTPKTSIRGKRKKAGWDNNSLLKVLRARMRLP